MQWKTKALQRRGMQRSEYTQQSREKIKRFHGSICVMFNHEKILETTLCRWIWTYKIANYLKNIKCQNWFKKRKSEFTYKHFKNCQWTYLLTKSGIRAKWFHSDFLGKKRKRKISSIFHKLFQNWRTWASSPLNFMKRILPLYQN